MSCAVAKRLNGTVSDPWTCNCGDAAAKHTPNTGHGLAAHRVQLPNLVRTAMNPPRLTLHFLSTIERSLGFNQVDEITSIIRSEDFSFAPFMSRIQPLKPVATDPKLTLSTKKQLAVVLVRPA